MPLLNRETTESYKRRVFKEMQYFGWRLKFIGCMVKFFWLCSAEINVAMVFWGKKLLFKKNAAWLPFRKILSLA